MIDKRRLTMIPALFAVILILSLSITDSHAKKPGLGGDFELIAHTGETFRLSDIQGKVGLIFFGFTHCPDVCPNTLVDIQRLLASLKEQSSHLQILFISVDPKRDTPEILDSYVSYFNKNIIGLTGTQEQVNQVLEQYHGTVSFKGDTDSTTYSVEHVANMYLINKQGEVASIILPRTPFAVLEQQVRKLINQ